MVANPNLTQWLNEKQIVGNGQSALVVGCGLGDDAEELARRGFRSQGSGIDNRHVDCRCLTPMLFLPVLLPFLIVFAPFFSAFDVPEGFMVGADPWEIRLVLALHGVVFYWLPWMLAGLLWWFGHLIEKRGTKVTDSLPDVEP